MENCCLGKKLSLNKNVIDKGITFVGNNGIDKFVSYKKVYDSSLKVLGLLQRHRIRKGSKVIVYVEDEEKYIYAIWACVLGGIIAVPISVSNNNENYKGMLNIWNKLDNSYVLISEELAGKVNNIYQESSEEESYGDLEEKFIFIEEGIEDDDFGIEDESDIKDIALIMFSSGSTSEPKGIILSHENIVNAVEDVRQHLEIKENDIFLNWMPLTHAIGLNFFHIIPLVNLVNQVLIDPKLFIKNPMIWMEKINEYRATITVSPNIGFEQFVQNYDSSDLNVKWDLSCIRSFIGSAEPLSEDLLNKFLNVLEKYNFKKSAMKNLYGMTESVLGISLTTHDKSMEFVKLDRNNLDIGNRIKIVENGDGAIFAVSGTPLKSLSIRVCNDQGEVLENETIGNIQVKGINMTAGYYENDSANKDLYSDDGWLKTGDIGFLKEGEIIITGRAKDIIILNGQNVYANDIERIARKVNISEVEKVIACGVFDDKLHGEKLIIFLKYDGSIYDFILYKNKIKTIVSNEMNISIENIIPIKEVPETASGKVKRGVLIKRYLCKEYDEIIEEIKLKEAGLRKEKNKSNINNDQVTNTLMEICRRLLNNSNIDKDDNLFEFGLDSIVIIKIQAEVKKKLNCDIKISDFINKNTINLLSEICKGNNSNNNNYPLLESNTKELYEPFSLTEIQMAYEMGRNENLEGGGVCTHFYHEIKTKYDIEKLNVCLNKIINNCPMMRVVFEQYGKQRILKAPLQYKIINEDISDLSLGEKEQVILKERERMSHQVFNVEKWPLFEFKSFKISDKENYLFVSLDLIIADAASMFKLGELLVDMYNDNEMVLPNLDFTFRDYIIGNERLKKCDMYIKDKEYWQNKIDDFPTAPVLPYKMDIAKLKKPKYKRLSSVIDKESWQILKDLSKKNKITPSALLCTAYAKVMAFWSNQNHLAINLTAFNRYPFNKDVDDIFGDFTSVIPLDIHIKTSDTKSFLNEAVELQEVILESLEHRHYDGVEFIRDLRINNKLGINKAVMPIVFSSLLFKSGRYAWREMGEIEYAVSQTSQVFIDNQVMEYDGVLAITWDYVEQLFDEEVINEMFDQYIHIIKSLINEGNIYKLTISDHDKNIIKEFNDTDIPRSKKTLHEMFEKAAKDVPENIAVSLENDSITYKELDEKSNKVANYLLRKNISRNNYVGVIVNRKIETIINILGVLKAGCAYVPMEPSYPQERIDYIVENSKIEIVLRDSSYNKLNIENEERELVRIENHPEDMAYVIYTSGSTGKPKGVKIKHSAAVNTIEDINEKFEVGQEDKVIGLSSMCFDLSVYDIFGALSSGAELVLIEDQRDVENVKSVMMKKEITIWNSVPAIMQMFIENEFEEADENDERYWKDDEKVEVELGWTCNLRLVLMSGDWIPLKLPDRIKKVFLNAEVVGLGGATEASIWSNYFIIDEIEDEWNSIPYGYPLGNQKFYVLNFDGEMCPVGIKGELYIGGLGIAEGYLNEEEKTKNQFIYNEKLGKIYKTGDYGIIKKRGYMEFLGRKDNQIKIRGYRIELGEIQNKLLENKNIRKVAVIEREDNNKNKIICAYIVADENVVVKELRSYLIERLPEYMVPNYFVKLNDIPLTANGKLNRRELPEPLDPVVEEINEYMKPENEIENELYNIWKKMLGKDNVGLNDNFFEVGGNSMLLIKMYKEIDKKYPGKLKMGEMFSSTTISKLAKAIERRKK